LHNFIVSAKDSLNVDRRKKDKCTLSRIQPHLIDEQKSPASCARMNTTGERRHGRSYFADFENPQGVVLGTLSTENTMISQLFPNSEWFTREN
jgi:hypothetical protein